MPGDAHRHRQDHHLPRAHHLLPAPEPSVRQAHLLHTHRAGDGEGPRGASRTASLPREGSRQGFGDHGARVVLAEKHVHPPEGRRRGQQGERGRAMPPAHRDVGPRQAPGGGRERGGGANGGPRAVRIL